MKPRLQGNHPNFFSSIKSGKVLASIIEAGKIESKFCLRMRNAYASIRQMDVLTVKTKQLRPAIY